MGREYFQKYRRSISAFRLKNIIKELLNTGLISEERDPSDKRTKRYYPIKLNIKGEWDYAVTYVECSLTPLLIYNTNTVGFRKI